MIVIIGTGAVAAEITFFIKGFHLVKGYIEYPENIEKYYNKYHLKKPILGDIDSYEIKQGDEFMLGVADIPFRRKVINKIKSKGGKFINFIHPSSVVSPDFIQGEGNFISPFCMVDPNVKIGDFNLLTGYSALSHDCTLGDNNILSSSILCGHVTAGSDNRFCIKSAVIPHITIGNGTTIQAGMTVDKDVPNNSTIFYRFKEKIII